MVTNSGPELVIEFIVNAVEFETVAVMVVPFIVDAVVPPMAGGLANKAVMPVPETVDVADRVVKLPAAAIDWPTAVAFIPVGNTAYACPVGTCKMFDPPGVTSVKS